MTIKRLSALSRILLVAAAIVSTPLRANSEQGSLSIHLGDDQSVTLRFFGSAAANLFTRELDESFQGVLEKNFVATTGNGFPAGFVNASLPGFPWAGTMWSRDGGTFMRELVMRGYYQHASLLADCLMNLVQKNPQGFYSFPRYFRGMQRGSGTNLDGTASIVIGMVLLWERLPDGNPTKDRIQHFLFEDASPVDYFKFQLQTTPLLAGSGEFGCGEAAIGRECINVVQNNLARLALLAVADMADKLGDTSRANEYRSLAAKIMRGMLKYLVAKDGSWIWCIDLKTLRPDPAIVDSPDNRGTGALNGVLSMYADVSRFLPLDSSWAGLQPSKETFEHLFRTPLRAKEFDLYGIWTQADAVGAGLMTSPSYGQGYALQDMLLLDKLGMAEKGLSWLANATYKPVPEYKLHRASRYYFYERMYSPDAVGKIPLAEGCGALNLVNVSEPLKVSRLMLGVDDSSLKYVRIIPRIPSKWKGVEAHNWPIRTRRGVVRANVLYENRGTGGELTMRVSPGEEIDDLQVRMPSKNGYIWREQRHATYVHFVTQ